MTPTAAGARSSATTSDPRDRRAWRLSQNAQTYQYEGQRSDFDGLAAPAIPSSFVERARSAASQAGCDFGPDICIVNFYTAESRMGVHQDKDERPETLAAGIPIVSVSLGDAARFVVGGLTRASPRGRSSCDRVTSS